MEERDIDGSYSPYKITVLADEDPPSNLIHLSKALLPGTDILGVKASKFEFCGCAI